MITIELTLTEAQALYNLSAYGRSDVDRILVNFEKILLMKIDEEQQTENLRIEIDSEGNPYEVK